ncbi:MAG: orotidine-5'-phosphate decarboxylase [Deltaproteobacteria bacterium]|jgi:orotidine-5'-phosphate decarboxylase|nr:orotidine-5'-phosphate decarboxylase [Deltaproteobacteria bacterium]
MSPKFADLSAALSRIVFPLDGNKAQALAWAEELGSLVGVLKIGLELYAQAGPSIVKEVKDLAPKAQIFLDLKLHDIPATVAGAAAVAPTLGVDYLTVHAQAGIAALKAAVKAAFPVKILGVTLLTSLDPLDLPELAPAYQEPGQYALLLAQRAGEAGCPGLVCSPQEIALFRGSLPSNPLLFVPGIRPLEANIASAIPDSAIHNSAILNDDQKRVGDPAGAIKAGADYLVIGRPIRGASDRRLAAQNIAREMLLV